MAIENQFPVVEFLGVVGLLTYQSAYWLHLYYYQLISSDMDITSVFIPQEDDSTMVK